MQTLISERKAQLKNSLHHHMLEETKSSRVSVIGKRSARLTISPSRATSPHLDRPDLAADEEDKESEEAVMIVQVKHPLSTTSSKKQHRPLRKSDSNHTYCTVDGTIVSFVTAKQDMDELIEYENDRARKKATLAALGTASEPDLSKVSIRRLTPSAASAGVREIDYNLFQEEETKTALSCVLDEKYESEGSSKNSLSKITSPKKRTASAAELHN